MKLGRKLEAFWELDFAAFRAEIKKRFKSDIPLAERTEWEIWLADTRREIERLSAEIMRTETQINSYVQNLYNLTDTEIELLEANI